MGCPLPPGRAVAAFKFSALEWALAFHDWVKIIHLCVAKDPWRCSDSRGGYEAVWSSSTEVVVMCFIGHRKWSRGSFPRDLGFTMPGMIIISNCSKDATVGYLLFFRRVGSDARYFWMKSTIIRLVMLEAKVDRRTKLRVAIHHSLSIWVWMGFYLVETVWSCIILKALSM